MSDHYLQEKTLILYKTYFVNNKTDKVTIKIKAQWISPEVHSEVIWDYSILEETSEKKLAKKAVSSTLSKSEETRLIETLKNDPELALEWGFTPDTVPVLVEAYIELSYQIFYKLNQHPTIQE